MNNTSLTYEQRFIQAAKNATLNKGHFANYKTTKDVFTFEFIKRAWTVEGEFKTLFEFSIIRNEHLEDNLKACWEDFCFIYLIGK